jgi:hypothetical protein
MAPRATPGEAGPKTLNDRPIHHVCYIVDDMPKAVDQWVEVTGATGSALRLGCGIRPRPSLSGTAVARWAALQRRTH